MIKQLTGLVICSTLLLTSSCDPERNTQGTYYTSLKSSVSNAAPAISLGDTLRFTLLWPDILDTKNGNGETRNEPVTTLQEAWFAYRIFRVDTINNTVYTKTGDSTKVNFFLTEGYENTPCQLCYTGTVFLQRTAKPFRGILNLVPPSKVFFTLRSHHKWGPSVLITILKVALLWILMCPINMQPCLHPSSTAGCSWCSKEVWKVLESIPSGYSDIMNIVTTIVFKGRDENYHPVL